MQVPILSEKDMEKIHNTGMEILEKVGMKTTDEVIAEIGNCKGVKVRGKRLLFSQTLMEEMVNELLQKREKECSSVESKGLTFGLPGCLPECYLEIGERNFRPLKSEDILQMIKVSDILSQDKPSVTGIAAGMASDISAPLQTLYANKLAAQYHSKGIMPRGYTSIKDAELIFEMQGVLGQKIGTGTHLPSPLVFEGNEVEVTLKFRKKSVSWGVSSMPMGGATAPFNIFGILAQNVAEIWGGYTILKLLEPEKPAGCSMTSYVFDMQNANIDFRTYKAVLMLLYTYQMNRFYKTEGMGIYAFNVSFCLPGVSSGIYSASALIPALLMGAKRFGMGLLGIDKIFSWEKTFYDIESIKFCSSLLQPFPFPEEGEIIQTIQEVIEGKEDFLTHPATLQNFRKDWYPEYLRNFQVQEFGKRKNEIPGTMKERKERMLKKHNYILEKEKFEEMEKIYQEGKRRLL